jgi:hypothetical protein
MKGRISKGLRGMATAFFWGAMLVALMIGSSGQAQAVTGTYKVALLRTNYSNATGHIYTLAQLQQAATEIEDFYRVLSHGLLDLQVSVADATVSGSRLFYWANERRFVDSLAKDAAEDAAWNGFDFTGFNVIAVLSPWYERNFTFEVPRKISSREPASYNRLNGDFIEVCKEICFRNVEADLHVLGRRVPDVAHLGVDAVLVMDADVVAVADDRAVRAAAVFQAAMFWPPTVLVAVAGAVQPDVNRLRRVLGRGVPGDDEHIRDRGDVAGDGHKLLDVIGGVEALKGTDHY